MPRVSVKLLLSHNAVAVRLTNRNDANIVKEYAAMQSDTSPAIEVDKNDVLCVIDGIHRLCAAEARGDEEIETWHRL